MKLNLADPDGILAWWRVLPDRHSDYLDYKIRTSAEFAPAIRDGSATHRCRRRAEGIACQGKA